MAFVLLSRGPQMTHRVSSQPSTTTLDREQGIWPKLARCGRQIGSHELNARFMFSSQRPDDFSERMAMSDGRANSWIIDSGD